MTVPATDATPPGWAGLPDPGERLPWRGRPDTAVRSGAGDIAEALEVVVLIPGIDGAVA